MQEKVREILEGLIGTSKDEDLTYAKDKEWTSKHWDEKINQILSAILSVVREELLSEEEITKIIVEYPTYYPNNIRRLVNAIHQSMLKKVGGEK